jgi:hypothetical protein
MRATLVMTLLLTGCGESGSLLVEQHEITEGGFNGLKIGMNRIQVVDVATALGTRLMTAVPCEKFRVYTGSTNILPSFVGLEGIRITDDQSHFQDIYFRTGKVTKVVGTPAVELVAGVTTGQAVSDLRDLLGSKDSSARLAISPIVDVEDAGILNLDVGASSVEGRVQKHDCWRFEVNSVKPAGAVYEIAFGPSGLNSIKYRRARIRSE